MVDFLLFLKPIAIGRGMLFAENEIRDRKCLNVAVYHNHRLHVVELNKQNGQKCLEESEKQLVGCLDCHKLDKGHLAAFSFIKGKKFEAATKSIEGKTIVKAIV
jgi:hypothetical protein